MKPELGKFFSSLRDRFAHRKIEPPSLADRILEHTYEAVPRPDFNEPVGKYVKNMEEFQETFPFPSPEIRESFEMAVGTYRSYPSDWTLRQVLNHIASRKG